MNGSVIVDFQNVTKYPILEFLERYRNFMLNDYEPIRQYFNGESVSVDNSHMNELSWLTIQCRELQATFKNFSNKFNSCAYWELMEFIDSLSDTIEKINKLPKFLRTSLSKRGYTPSIQVKTTVGSNRTVEDVAAAVNGVNTDNTSWVDIMVGNDMEETDWSIDKLTGLDIFINNSRKVVVTTVLDQPIGKRVYGIDIQDKIEIQDNDLVLVKYKDNIQQKCKILLELTRGDVPENRLFGKNPFYLHNSVKSMNYAQIANDIRDVFLQNDLFESVILSDMKFNNGDLHMTFGIKTKYDYETEKTVVL